MKKLFSLPIVKRKTVCGLLGIGFGFLCAYFASKDPSIGPDFWGSALMWNIVFNRLLIGIFVLIMGVYTMHPVFKFKLCPAFRGFFMGAFVSLGLAIGVLIVPSPEGCKIFWMTIISGGIYGLIIDVVATKIAGDGKKLLDKLY